jgi:hypothetical protein
MKINGNTHKAYEQQIAAERAKRLAMPRTFEFKPLTKLPAAPFQRPVYDAPGCKIRSIHDRKDLV